MSTLVQRRDATQKTLDAFKDRPFEWWLVDCGMGLAATHLRNLGIDPRIERFRRYSTEAGAYRSLKRAGFSDLDGVMDDLLGIDARIHPARTLVGDVLAFREIGGRFALTVAVGNGRVLGFHPATRTCIVCQPDFNSAVSVAWKVLSNDAPSPG